jgi:hypothetical protein
MLGNAAAAAPPAMVAAPVVRNLRRDVVLSVITGFLIISDKLSWRLLFLSQLRMKARSEGQFSNRHCLYCRYADDWKQD